MPNHRLCESIQGTLELRNKEGNGSMDYDGKQGANDGSSPKSLPAVPAHELHKRATIAKQVERGDLVRR